MAPKVKSNILQPPEAMATQPDTSSEDIAQQRDPPGLPSKTKRGKAKAQAETDSSQPAGLKTPKRGRSCAKSKTVKENRSKCGQPAPGTPRGRPSKASLFISAVASKCSVHQHVVESVLRAVEAVAVAALKDKRKFSLSFIQGKLNEKPETPAKEKDVLGKLVSVPARTAIRTVRFSPTKEFRKLFE